MLSYRNGTNPYNRAITQDEIRQAFSSNNFVQASVTPDRTGHHMEFRLPDAMIHPFIQVLTCVFLDAFYLAIKNGKTFPFWCTSRQQINDARRAILRRHSEPLQIGNVTIGRTEYIQKVIAFYREELETCLNTCSPKLRRCLVQLINLLIDGLCFNIFTIDMTADQLLYFDDQYKFFTRPYATFKAFKKIFEVPKRKATSLRDLKEEKESKLQTDTNFEIIELIRANNYVSLKKIRKDLLEKYNHRSESASLRKVQRMLKKFRETYLNKVFWTDGVKYLYLRKKNDIIGGEY